MKRKIRREILIETEQIVFLKNQPSGHYLKCLECEENSLMIQPEYVSERLEIGTREIYRLIEANGIHFLEDESKKVFICLRSLAKVVLSNEGKIH